MKSCINRQYGVKRVVFYPEMIAFGGAERIMLALSKHLHNSAVAHELALYYLSVDLQSHAEWPVPIRQLSPPRHPLMKAWSLGTYLKSQATAVPGLPLLVGIQAALHAGTLPARDYVLMILDTPSLLGQLQLPNSAMSRLTRSARNRLSHLVLRRGMRRAKAVIATSNYMAEEMKSLYGVESKIIRQGGFSPRVQAGRPTNRQKELRMLSVSRLESNKRIDWILQAFFHLEFSASPSKPDNSWRLDIVGEGSERSRLEHQARTLGLQQRVTFHGYISDHQLEELYSNASLFLMPAWQGYGLPALEALLRHIPVVLHRQSGVSEILQDTPWVEQVDGDLPSFNSGLSRMCTRIKSGCLAAQPLPRFPTEQDWADEICRICGWRQDA